MGLFDAMIKRKKNPKGKKDDQKGANQPPPPPPRSDLRLNHKKANSNSSSQSNDDKTVYEPSIYDDYQSAPMTPARVQNMRRGMRDFYDNDSDVDNSPARSPENKWNIKSSKYNDHSPTKVDGEFASPEISKYVLNGIKALPSQFSNKDKDDYGNSDEEYVQENYWSKKRSPTKEAVESPDTSDSLSIDSYHGSRRPGSPIRVRNLKNLYEKQPKSREMVSQPQPTPDPKPTLPSTNRNVSKPLITMIDDLSSKSKMNMSLINHGATLETLPIAEMMMMGNGVPSNLESSDNEKGGINRKMNSKSPPSSGVGISQAKQSQLRQQQIEEEGSTSSMNQANHLNHPNQGIIQPGIPYPAYAHPYANMPPPFQMYPYNGQYPPYPYFLPPVGFHAAGQMGYQLPPVSSLPFHYPGFPPNPYSSIPPKPEALNSSSSQKPTNPGPSFGPGKPLIQIDHHPASVKTLHHQQQNPFQNYHGKTSIEIYSGAPQHMDTLRKKGVPFIEAIGGKAIPPLEEHLKVGLALQQAQQEKAHYSKDNPEAINDNEEIESGKRRQKAHR